MLRSMSDAYDVQVAVDPVDAYNCPSCNAHLDMTGRKAFTLLACPSCANVLQVPGRFGGFLLLELLGVGGMGATYRARDESLNRNVAIKVMRRSLGENPAFLQTFRHEAQAAARINHAHVVQIYSFGEFKNQPYIVMEMITGGSLDRMLASGEPFDQTLAIRIGNEIAAALQMGYESKMLHGDLKPENILLDEKGSAKLVDFGIAQMAGANSKEVWGTPYYVAPEKVRRQRTDCRSDIYSLGGTLYHILARQPPFDGPDAAAVVKARFLKPAPPLREKRKDIDPEVEAIVARMLQVEPAMRYPTYESLRADMTRYLEKAGPLFNVTKKIAMLRKKATGQITTSSSPISSTTTSSVTRTTGSLNRTTGSVAAGVPPPPTTSAPATSKPGRIVIQANATRMMRKSSSSSGENTSRQESKPLPMWVLLLGFVGLLLVGAAAGVIFWYASKHRDQASVPTEDVHVQEARTAAVYRIKNIAMVADVTRTNLNSLSEISGMIVSQTVRQVVASDVLSPELREQLQPPRPLPPPPPEVATAAVATTNAVGTNAALTAKTPAKPIVAQPPPAEPQDPPNLPPVVAKMRAMYRDWYRIEAIALDATEKHTDLVNLWGAVTANVSTNNPEALNAKADMFETELASLNPGGELNAEVHKKMFGLRQSSYDTTNVMLVAMVVDKKKKAALAADAAAAAAEAAAAAAKKLELEKRAKEQVAKVQAKELEIRELLHKMDFVTARRNLRSINEDLTTAEGQKALGLAIERITRFEILRDFLIGKLPGYQHPGEKMIESADEKGLVVGGLELAWADIPDTRIALFIRYFIFTDEQAKNLKLREQVDQLINGAMYLRYFLKTNEKAQEAAGKMLEKAVSLIPVCREDIARLLPDEKAGKEEATSSSSSAPSAADNAINSLK
jgi:serine/threonine protein kinase